jgi:predicted RNase H-like nuclease
MLGFGIDLAGYTTGKTAVAVVEIEGRSIKATLLRGSALSKKRESKASLDQALSEEVADLRRCFAIGPVAVDIPIDLQGLPNPPDCKYIWQLTLRPIDREVGAMPAFADRIGSPVARFAAIMREGNFDALLGERLFEAYPAATLKMLDIKARRYKGPKGAQALESLCKTLKIEPSVDSDDDIDAIICAITAAAPTERVREAGTFNIDQIPRGFRIPKSLSFDEIRLATADFDAWMEGREGSGAA